MVLQCFGRPGFQYVCRRRHTHRICDRRKDRVAPDIQAADNRTSQSIFGRIAYTGERRSHRP